VLSVVRKLALALAFSAAAIALPAAGVPATTKQPVSLLACSGSASLAPAGFEVPAGGVPLGLAMADFTGDTHPDLATLELAAADSVQAHYVVEVQLTEGSRQSLLVTAAPRNLVITPMDVTGDGTLDLVIRAVGFSAPVAVFLYDGCGHFSPREPARYAGAIKDELPDSKVFAPELSFASEAIARGTSAADSERGSENPLGRQEVRLLARHDDVPSRLFLPFGSNKAPPAAA